MVLAAGEWGGNVGINSILSTTVAGFSGTSNAKPFGKDVQANSQKGVLDCPCASNSAAMALLPDTLKQNHEKCFGKFWATFSNSRSVPDPPITSTSPEPFSSMFITLSCA
jgi:hypothetical protein